MEGEGAESQLMVVGPATKLLRITQVATNSIDLLQVLGVVIVRHNGFKV
jgi:hypothetical protein